MSAQPTRDERQHRRFSSRGSSRALDQRDVDIINRYSRKYSNTYQTAPYQALYGASSQSRRNIHGIPDSVSVASSMSQSSPAPPSHASHVTNSVAGTKVVHAKRPSNLVSHTNHNMWNDAALSNQSNDMESAMQNMIQTYQTKLEKQQHFMESIEQEATQNKDFGKVENADNWSNLEVCHWLNSIHLDKYIQSFADQIIDGSILIRDLDETILVSELGVKRIHVKKIMREIVKLRQLAKLTDDVGSGGKDALVESLKLEITSLQRENKHLRDQIKTMQNQSQTSSNLQELANSATASHFSSNTSSMSSIPSGATTNNNTMNTMNTMGTMNSQYTSKYGSSSQQHRKGTGGYGMQSHNYTVNPRSKKY